MANEKCLDNNNVLFLVNYHESCFRKDCFVFIYLLNSFVYSFIRLFIYLEKIISYLLNLNI